MKVKQVYVGGWLNKTSLHLSEIYDFFLDRYDNPGLKDSKMDKLRANLDLNEVKFCFDGLECLEVTTKGGVDFEVFEDGLVVLGRKRKDGSEKTLKADIDSLTNYYENHLSPALSELFSLGAPNPRELTDIKTSYPFFVVLDDAKMTDMKKLLTAFHQTEYFEVNTKTFDILRGDKLYIINSKGESMKHIQRFVEEQIFLREFKSRLHHYLNVHRSLWGKIDRARSRGELTGDEVEKFHSEIEADDHTITLVDARIKQMGTYLRTREMRAKNDATLKDFEEILLYRYESMEDTLEYMQGIWTMTRQHLAQAKERFGSIQNEMTNRSIEGLSVIMAIGVIATTVQLVNEIPDLEGITPRTVIIFAILASLVIGIIKLMSIASRRRKYTVAAERSKKLG
ncbi:hypothetical protein FWC63_02125 [Candidatus Saccharibacteria bacterium]|nr:hypothetical protein [Candidatus Saccharibacteria bacterium]